MDLDVHAGGIDLLLALKKTWSARHGRPVPDPIERQSFAGL